MNPQDPNIINPTSGTSAADPVAPPSPAGPNPQNMFQPVAPQGPIGQPPQAMPPYSYTTAPSQNPASPPLAGKSTDRVTKSKKPFIVGGIIAGLLVVIIIIVAVILGGSKKPNTAPSDQSSTKPQGPQPAQAIDIEQANNSISQDITSHDNNRDFPFDHLDDKALGL